MAGTKKGGQKSAVTSMLRYGKDFYSVIGRAGGKKSTGGGFASPYLSEDGLTGPQRARIVGRRGGLASRRKRRELNKEEKD